MTTGRSALRRLMRERRREVPPAARIGAAGGLAAQLLAHPLPPGAHVAGYWAADGEIPLHVWQLRLPGDVTYCLPVLHEDGRLRFAPWKAGEAVEANRYGIPEPVVAADALLQPERLDLVVVPLVGFDHRCHRLGMGGGWYDRSFAFRHHAPAPPVLVGAAFAFQQVVGELPSEDWDVQLDAVCTDLSTVSRAT
ncbi:5-formyltetrahydrofolate cyclo-ligase [Luteimonas padinae]|uniref:5-formyltetrahydrofolate cyclo-ligase n=1 Tax=Luteimonas padinae TaxID=1714359 RepID=A0ABV6SUR4_9GAMM|nr:5-formyltetrahydrofolate cyclo-ligase [Luteimonas padinae]GHD73839.1 5-formyltetrahydrofolate cyclo-ligase [Luteimonas padinae]